MIGDSSLYDSTSINVVASPLGSSPSLPSPAVVKETSPPSAVSTPPPQSNTHFTNSNFAVLFAKPDSYLDATVDIMGKVSNFPEPGLLQMNIGDSDTVVHYDETFVFVKDDCVKVTGLVEEQFMGTNAFMATRVVPSISAKTIDKIDCSQAIDPAEKTLVLEKTQSKGGNKSHSP